MLVILATFHGFLLAPASAAGQDAPILVVAASKPTPEPVQTIEAALPAEAAEEPAEDEAFEPGWVSLGLSCLIGTRPAEGGVEPTWMPGVDLGFRPEPWIALGVRRARVTATEREMAVGLSPYLELAARPWERLDLYAQVGGALDLIVAHAGDDVRGAAAVFAGGGARLYLAEIFSLAVETAVHVPVVTGLVAGNSLLPPQSVHLSAGLALAFHWN